MLILWSPVKVRWMINLWLVRRRLGWPAPRQDQVYRSSHRRSAELSPPTASKAGISAAYALTDLEPDLDRYIAEASSLLQQIGAQIAKNWLA